MTSISLNAALTGLKAAQKALDTVSSNIANAGTVGYTRKILPQETLIVAGVGNGVKTQALVRNVDKALIRDLAKQVSIKYSASVRENYLSRIQDFHGASEAERALSSQIGKLADGFAALSSSPDNNILLSSTVTTAQQVAQKFNDFSALLTQQRNQAETEIEGNIQIVNALLTRIADLNVRISNLDSAGQSTADLEDQRDQAIREVSQHIEVSTFVSENNKLTVMTRQGQTLADESPRHLVFGRSQVLPTSYYPNDLSGLYIDSTSGIEVRAENAGGSLGALLTLRDQTLPSYQAQIDELAYQLAARFDAQGLRLFTDASGFIPSSTTPPTPAPYVGFAAQIQVNEDIVDDPTLLRSGTYGQTVLPGSNEIIRKISEFALGAYAYQQATGTADISAGTIFTSSGMAQTNRLTGTVDITDYAPDLDAAPNITAPASFTLTIGVTPYNITINPGDTATDLVNTINTAVGSTVAGLNGIGQLTLNTTSSITLADAGIGALGIADLGLSFGLTPASNPSFSVQVGTQSPVNVTIGPADTAATLLATLNTIPGLTASLGSGGELILAPTQGGDVKIQNTNGTPIAALGLTMSNVGHPPFRQASMGPGANLSTGILGNSTLEDYARSLISSQSQDHSIARDTVDKEESFFQTLDARNSNMSGVDIDQEMSELIRIQTAYTAAARMISASEKIFDDLFIGFFGG